MTELHVVSHTMPATDLSPENPLPAFRDHNPDHVVTVEESVPQDDRKNLGWRTTFRVLPYRMQDGYGRKKQPRAFTSVVLENEHLRAIVLPELGGRLISLYHKKTGQELVDPVTFFQPANLALRNAWFCGGIEWNTPHLGHHYLTCSPVFASRVAGSRGEPVLRLYAWERVKCFPYQIDLHLPPGSEFLFARIRLINPHDKEIPMYWWTNIGVTQDPERRVLVPADTAIHNTPKGFALTDLPIVDGYDFTYATNAPFAKEFFFRIPEDARPWMAALDGNGMGLVQTSTARLRGRKMFVFGSNSGGQRWQDFLLEPGRAYFEIQAGLARTQFESIPMPARTEWTWTEAFGLLQADNQRAHGACWTEARLSVEQALDEKLPRRRLDELDKEFSPVTTRSPQEVLVQGDGWGALERRRYVVKKTTDRIPPEFVFNQSLTGPDEEPWLELLEKGALPVKDPDQEPGAFMIQDEWRVLLEESIRQGAGAHWLSWLHLGIMRIEALDVDGARAAWQQSLQCRRNAWALRNLAVLETRNKDLASACDLMKQAWEIGPHVASLALEYASLLLRLERFDDLREFVEKLPDGIQQHERMLLISAKLALFFRDYSRVDVILKHDFATIQEGEVTLSDLWFTLQEKQIAETEGIPMDEALRKRVRRELVPPRNLDFRIAAEIE